MPGLSNSGLLFSAPLLAGDSGTAQTIDQIRNLVDDAWKDSRVNAFVIKILRAAGVQQFDAWAQVKAIYDWVHNNFYFINDPVSKEALRPTIDLLQMRAGDCDDINANVLPALLGSIGYECRIVTIAGDPSQPGQMSHVYAEVWLDGNWIPLDAARPGAMFGVAPPRFYRREWWSLTSNDHADYPGPGQMLSYGSNWPVLDGPRARLRGLGDVSLSQLISSGVQTVTGLVSAVDGQPVVPSVLPASGPGGYSTIVPTSATVAPPVASSPSMLLLLLGAGLLLFAVSK